MTSEKILEAIAAWKAISTDPVEVVKFLEQGNCFTYHNKVYPLSSSYLHAYPGIHDGKLMFFIIPDAYDKEEYIDDLSDYVQSRHVMWSLLGSHTIPAGQAEIRIARWIAEYQGWTPKQIERPDGIFLAFAIPADDFVSEECLATFGLQLGGDEGGLLSADLIVCNANNKTIVQFDDFSKPVPPYGAQALESSFYLLQA